MKTLLKKTLLIIVLYVPFQSMAWGTLGHRISGQIAESYLTPKACAAVKAILGNESIAMASNWADYIKSDPAYAYLSSWHYIDFDKPYTYPEMRTYLAADTNVDAFTKLEFCIAQLKKGNLSKSNKLLYLHMLIHITEDIHQPLHTGHAEDKGGNDIKVNWFSTQTNLHSVWDSQLIDFQQLSYTEYAASINHATPAEVAQWQKTPVSMWIFESSQIANILYKEVKQGDTLTYKYNFNHLDTLNRQLLKGGVRLASLLNQIFG